MAKYIRYKGEFLSRASVVWRTEIWQEADEAFTIIRDLTFEADEPLTIEWHRAEKSEVVCSSTATLRIESPGDRTYEDLYAIEPGCIRMDVYRNDKLYWSGTLDPEFYEEPYERASKYPVSLTFSDFGILDRLKYSLSGMQTIEAIIDFSLKECGISYNGVDYTTMASTKFEDNTRATIERISVRSDNFYDEEGEASTLKDVVEGILQPLALRLIQRAGHIYIYDLNGLYESDAIKRIEWDGSSSTLGTDRVYNNVKINFYPYSSAGLLDGEVRFDGEYSTDMVNISNDSNSYYSYYPGYGEEYRYEGLVDYRQISFTIFLSSKGGGLAYLNPSARYCHILPMLNGPEESDAIAWSFYTGGHGDLISGWPRRKLNKVSKGDDQILMKTERIFIPKLEANSKKNYYLRLCLPMLLDARYNPFTDANESNESGNYGEFKIWTGWAFVPVGITLYDKDGKAICHYDNKLKTETSTQGSFQWSMERSSWKSGDASFGDCWLEYYDPDDLGNSAGILGWQTNRQNIGRPDIGSRIGYYNGSFPSSQGEFHMYESFKAQPAGEYIPYPTEGGYLEIVVYTGVRCFDFGENGTFEQTMKWDSGGLYDKIRWLLYKAPVLDLVKNNLVFDDAELDDVEYTGYLNVNAKEELSIDTICGTANKVCPTAKGIYHRTTDSLQIQKLKRAGVVDHPERLLIGTLYSQYANRKTTLEGECKIDHGGLSSYEEANQGNKRFLISGETQDVITDCTEALFTEFNPDEYEAEK